jgi:hypothetical protein
MRCAITLRIVVPIERHGQPVDGQDGRGHAPACAQVRCRSAYRDAARKWSNINADCLIVYQVSALSDARVRSRGAVMAAVMAMAAIGRRQQQATRRWPATAVEPPGRRRGKGLDGQREMLGEVRAACMRHDPGNIASALAINLKWPGRGGLFLVPATIRRCFRWRGPSFGGSSNASLYLRAGTLGELRPANLLRRVVGRQGGPSPHSSPLAGLRVCEPPRQPPSLPSPALASLSRARALDWPMVYAVMRGRACGAIPAT